MCIWRYNDDDYYYYCTKLLPLKQLFHISFDEDCTSSCKKKKHSRTQIRSVVSREWKCEKVEWVNEEEKDSWVFIRHYEVFED